MIKKMYIFDNDFHFLFHLLALLKNGDFGSQKKLFCGCSKFFHFDIRTSTGMAKQGEEKKGYIN